jgi:hypothetical protein
MSYSSYGIEKGQLIRVPSTANLMVDSEDRPPIFDVSGVETTSPWNFQITRPQSLIQGFFTRIGVTEVVLEWCQPNISVSQGTYQFGIQDSSGVDHVLELADGNYTVENVLDTIVVLLNDLSLPGYTFSVTDTDGQVALDGGARTFAILPNALSFKLDLNNSDVETAQRVLHLVQCPD